jgi:hypothetical protein
MLSISFGRTLITAYGIDVPLEGGVKVTNDGGAVASAGTGEPMNNVGVTVAGGAPGVVPASERVQAVRVKSIIIRGKDFVFINFSFDR